MSGIIIIPVYIIYVIIGYIVFKLILKLFKKRLNSLIVLLIVIFFPFWDIFVANQILKILSHTTKYTIYEMPERDKDGKVESIGSSLTISFVDIEKYSSEKLQSFINRLREDNISEFIEFRTYEVNPKFKERTHFIAKIYLNPNAKKPYEIIEKSEARYIKKFVPSNDNISFLGFTIDKYLVEIHDTKKNKIIAIAPTVDVETPRIMNVIRGAVFMLISGGGGAPMFRTEAIVTGADLRKELFKDIEGVMK